MSDKKPAATLLSHNGHTIRHLQKHQDVNMEFWYLHVNSGREFDVRELPVSVIGHHDTDSLLEADINIHRRAIKAAIDEGHDFRAPDHSALIERSVNHEKSRRGMRP
jgi:hypothetical protein